MAKKAIKKSVKKNSKKTSKKKSSRKKSAKKQKLKLIITLDLTGKKSKQNYYVLNKKFKELGFSKFSKRKGLKLPNNTYYGEFNDDDMSLSDLRKDLLDMLKKAKLNPKRFFGGKLNDWTLFSKK